MALLGATALFPAVLALLAVGAGLLVDRLAGRALPLVLTPVAGLALLICAGQLTTAWAWSAPLTPVVFVLIALAGAVLGRARGAEGLRAARRAPQALLAALGVYGMAIAPVVLSGRTTFTAYLTDTVSGSHLAGAEYLLSNGRDFSALDRATASGAQIYNYFAVGNYPSGGHVLLGGVGRLVPVDLIWLYQPFLAAMLAFCAPSLWVVLRRVGLGPWWAMVAGVCASVPALMYAFDLVGAIKEVTAAAMIAFLAALVASSPRWITLAPRSVVPLALCGAAGTAAIGFAFGAWLLVAGAAILGGAILAVRRHRLELRALLVSAALAAGVVLAAALPNLLDLTKSLDAAEGIAETTDPGNLLQPMKLVQVLGVWINGTYRLDPSAHGRATYLLMGVVVVAVAFGVVQLVRARAWGLLAWFAGLAILWKVLTDRGAVWTDAKLIVLSAQGVALLAWAGVAMLVRSGRRVEAGALSALLVLGVMWSNAMLYHETNLAPTARFDELISIGEQLEGGATVLTPDFDEYSFYALRETRVNGPGYAYGPPQTRTFSNGTGAPYGATADLDTLGRAAFAGHRYIVVRRSPEASRPPSDYRLLRRGRFYEVWERRPGVAVLDHLGLQSDASPVARPTCSQVAALARTAAAAPGGARLIAAERPAPVVIDPRKVTTRSSGFVEIPDAITLTTPGTLTTTVDVPTAGRWRIWMRGDIGRTLDVTVDGRRAGSVGQQSGGQGNYLEPLTLELTAGEHRLEIARGGGSLRPGDATSNRLARIVLEPADAQSRLVALPAGRWRELCGRELDWVEAVAAAPAATPVPAGDEA